MTERRAISNKTNAQRSTGPKSVDGKSRSSKNAVKHGLSTMSPASGMENQLVEDFVGELTARALERFDTREGRRKLQLARNSPGRSPWVTLLNDITREIERLPSTWGFHKEY